MGPSGTQTEVLVQRLKKLIIFFKHEFGRNISLKVITSREDNYKCLIDTQDQYQQGIRP